MYWYVFLSRFTDLKIVFSSILEFPLAISSRLKDLVVWVSGLPVKDYFQMAIKAGATLPPETIDVSDDEDNGEVST